MEDCVTSFSYLSCCTFSRYGRVVCSSLENSFFSRPQILWKSSGRNMTSFKVHPNSPLELLSTSCSTSFLQFTRRIVRSRTQVKVILWKLVWSCARIIILTKWTPVSMGRSIRCCLRRWRSWSSSSSFYAHNVIFSCPFLNRVHILIPFLPELDLLS